MSDEESMAKAVGVIMNEQEVRVDPRLELYAQGLLSTEEQRELEQNAKDDPQLAIALELHQPLSPAFKDKLKATALDAPRENKILRFRRPAAAILAAAAAAAVTFVLIDRPGEVTPRYSLVARAGDAEWRGEALVATKNEARADSEIQIVLRPEKVIEGAIEAALYVVQDGHKERSPASAEISADGAVRWIGRADHLSGGRTGAIRLIAEVGRAGETPWHSSTIEVLIRPAP